MNIWEEYVPKRCEKLGFDFNDFGTYIKSKISTFHINSFIKRFISDCEAMLFLLSFMEPFDQDLLKYSDKQIIFEGAQGLQLDQDYGIFPNVTRSNTGLKNVVKLCKENGIKEFQVNYVSRIYTTRHGNGPLKNELMGTIGLIGLEKETNISNEFQGNFRFAKLDFGEMKKAIDFDMDEYLKDFSGVAAKQLCITCYDQLNLPDLIKNKYVSSLAQNLNFGNILLSKGPTRQNVSKFVI